MNLNILDLFSGIGGFSLGLHNADPAFKTVAFCEIDPYCQQVLNKNFKDIPIFEDVTKLNKDFLQAKSIPKIDIITAGFPCQDLSQAGKRAGLQGARSGLFYEVIRLGAELKPKFILLENVPMLTQKKEYLNELIKQLQKIGYDLFYQILRATSFGYPHRRKRVFIIAWSKEYFADSVMLGRLAFKNLHSEFLYKNNLPKLEKKTKMFNSLLTSYQSFPAPHMLQGDLRDIRSDDGIPDFLDRVKALGNSLIPDIPEIIGKSLIKTLKDKQWQNL